MSATDSSSPVIATIEHLARRYTVTCRVAFDGIEYVGRLWFAEEGWDQTGVPDRGALPGRTRDDVLDLARRISPEELGMRHRRALAEKRTFLRLRRVTEELLTKIRYMNQIAISMGEGLLDADGARLEIELTARQLHECVDRIRHNAGIED
jgi:hypothetical protein